jgi:hypothetical protein
MPIGWKISARPNFPGASPREYVVNADDIEARSLPFAGWMICRTRKSQSISGDRRTICHGLSCQSASPGAFARRMPAVHRPGRLTLRETIILSMRRPSKSTTSNRQPKASKWSPGVGRCPNRDSANPAAVW